MTIPIPSRQKRFTITVGIKASYPIAVGIWVYDPTRPNADYLRRKVAFRSKSFRQDGYAYREIQIPLPISPEQLLLEVYNKRTLASDGFKITKFDVADLPPSETWATPEQHRFMEFAIKFAQKAGHARAGFYHSPDHEFLIQYLPIMQDDLGNELVTPARIHREMPRVQLSRRVFRQLTIPVRIAILAHEGCHFFMNTRSERNADLCGLKYYLDAGFPKIEAVYAATKVFNHHRDSVGVPHVKRTRDIMNFIDRYRAEKELTQGS